jgi:23S rRNA pseudouridine2605 synthase
MSQQSPAEPIRLNKYIASNLSLSRRQADELIEQGRVRVNGQAAQLGKRVTLTDRVEVNGKVIAPHTQHFVYLALNKPTGYVCSRRQQGDRPTIYALLPQQYHRLKPVGRLDSDSSGLLLLTNDGDFAHRMTHPSFHKQKSYEVTLDQPLQPSHRQMIVEQGIALADGISKLRLRRLSGGNDRSWSVTMHEGRNRRIRRTFAALGYRVVKLRRVQFGPYVLDGLGPGKFEKVRA